MLQHSFFLKLPPTPVSDSKLSESKTTSFQNSYTYSIRIRNLCPKVLSISICSQFLLVSSLATTLKFMVQIPYFLWIFKKGFSKVNLKLPFLKRKTKTKQPQLSIIYPKIFVVRFFSRLHDFYLPSWENLLYKHSKRSPGNYASA